MRLRFGHLGLAYTWSSNALRMGNIQGFSDLRRLLAEARATSRDCRLSTTARTIKTNVPRLLSLMSRSFYIWGLSSYVLLLPSYARSPEA